MTHSWLRILVRIIIVFAVIYGVLWAFGYQINWVANGNVVAGAAGYQMPAPKPPTTSTVQQLVIAPFGWGFIIKAPTTNVSGTAYTGNSTLLPGGNTVTGGNPTGYYGTPNSGSFTVSGGTTGGTISGIYFVDGEEVFQQTSKTQ